MDDEKLTPENNNDNHQETASEQETKTEKPGKGNNPGDDLREAINAFKDIFADFKKQIAPIFDEFRSDMSKILTEFEANSENEINAAKAKKSEASENAAASAESETQTGEVESTETSSDVSGLINTFKVGVAHAAERINNGDFHLARLIRKELRDYINEHEGKYTVTTEEDGRQMVHIDRQFVEGDGLKATTTIINNVIKSGIKSILDVDFRNPEKENADKTEKSEVSEGTEAESTEEAGENGIRIKYEFADIIRYLYEKSPLEGRTDLDEAETQEARRNLLNSTKDLDDVLNGVKTLEELKKPDFLEASAEAEEEGAENAADVELHEEEGNSEDSWVRVTPEK